MEADLLALSTEHVPSAPVITSNGTNSLAHSVFETRNLRRKMEDCFTIEPNLNSAFDLDVSMPFSLLNSAKHVQTAHLRRLPWSFTLFRLCLPVPQLSN
jgi:hypothetical protein